MEEGRAMRVKRLSFGLANGAAWGLHDAAGREGTEVTSKQRKTAGERLWNRKGGCCRGATRGRRVWGVDGGAAAAASAGMSGRRCEAAVGGKGRELQCAGRSKACARGWMKGGSDGLKWRGEVAGGGGGCTRGRQGGGGGVEVKRCEDKRRGCNGRGCAGSGMHADQITHRVS